MNRKEQHESNIFFHIDVNSAFLSWSAVKRLNAGDSADLRTIPSVIGGDSSKRHSFYYRRRSEKPPRDRSGQIHSRQSIRHHHRRASGCRGQKMSVACHRTPGSSLLLRTKPSVDGVSWEHLPRDRTGQRGRMLYGLHSGVC